MHRAQAGDDTILPEGKSHIGIHGMQMKQQMNAA